MERKAIGPVLIVVLACLLNTFAIQPQKDRLTKDALIGSCELGSRERKTAGDWVDGIVDRDVVFTPSAQDEIDFRRACSYLDERGLNLIIAALRRSSPHGKALAAQMLKDIGDLIGEGKQLETVPYEDAVKKYRLWVAKVSPALGKVDFQMRFFRRDDTKFQQSFRNESRQICDLTRPSDESDRVTLENAKTKSVEALELIETGIKNITEPRKTDR